MAGGKAMVNECRGYFLAKVMVTRKTELKDVFKQTDLHWLKITDIYQFLIQSRSRYESSYSPSPSEVEELPSLATDSVFNNDNYERDVSQLSDEEKEKLIIEDQNNVVSPLRAISTISTVNEIEVKSTCNDNDKESSLSPPNQELEDTKMIPLIIVNEVNEQVIEMINHRDIMTDIKMMRDRYLRIRRDLCDYSSQKDWFIENYNISNGFRKYQISNIDKLVAGETFNFASSSKVILFLHNIMFIDSTTMKKPLYLNIDDERKWRISICQPRQQTSPSFLREIMDEYEA
ncbi:1190_t:CDS:2, partial [Funneliformis geosporum]